MIFELDRQSHTPLYVQIAARIRQLIATGTLHIGDRLPPNRALADSLGVNRSTVATAYDELLAEGLIASRVGSGTYVAAHPRPPAASPAAAPEPPLLPLNWETMLPELRPEAWLANSEAALHKEYIAFTHALPAMELFPVETFRHSVERVLRREGRRLLQLGASSGYEPLRHYLLQQMSLAGISARPDEILLTSGCQQALDLLRQTLLSAGDEVAVENPTYPGALGLFCQPQYKPIGIPIGEQGLDLDALEDVLRRRRPRLIYLVPTFQNPIGATMPMAARRRLIDLAARYRVPIVEDDIYRDLRYSGTALPPLKALDRYGVVIYLNSFSKVGFPGLRVGWIVAPALLIEHLHALRQRSDLHGNLLAQAALADFSQHGLFQRHLQRCRKHYAQRRDAMLAALQRHFPAEAHWSEPEGGMAIWVRLPEDANADALLETARQHGVFFTPGPRFFVSGARANTLRLSFTTVTPAQIEAGVKCLGHLVERQRSLARSARAPRGAIARKALV